AGGRGRACGQLPGARAGGVRRISAVSKLCSQSLSTDGPVLVHGLGAVDGESHLHVAPLPAGGHAPAPPESRCRPPRATRAARGSPSLLARAPGQLIGGAFRPTGEVAGSRCSTTAPRCTTGRRQ